MKSFYWFVLVTLAVLSPLFPGEEEEPAAIITSFSGTVRIERDGENIPLDAMVQLFEGDRIETGENGKIVILYSSGKFRSIGVSMTVVLLSQRSEDSPERSGNEEEVGNEEHGSENTEFEPLFAFNAAAERLGTRRTESLESCIETNRDCMTHHLHIDIPLNSRFSRKSRSYASPHFLQPVNNYYDSNARHQSSMIQRPLP